jgi:hypothetical protein
VVWGQFSSNTEGSMIRISIKVKNDHCSYTENFESPTLLLDVEDPHLVSMIEKVTKAFNQPVEEVKVKTIMEV